MYRNIMIALFVLIIPTTVKAESLITTTTQDDLDRVSIYIFWDNDQNGVYDNGIDYPVSDVMLHIYFTADSGGESYTVAKSDPTGRVYLRPLVNGFLDLTDRNCTRAEWIVTGEESNLYVPFNQCVYASLVLSN